MSDDKKDIDNNGKVDEAEIAIYRKKINAQMRMAGISLAAAILLTIFLIFPIIDENRLKILIDIITVFYVMVGSIVGAFMGFSTWLGIKKN